MAQIVVRETVQVPVTPPVPWKRELNMPPAEWFRGEWLPARMQREAEELAVETENSDVRKWLKLAAYTLTGIVFCGGVLGMYMMALAIIGTP